MSVLHVRRLSLALLTSLVIATLATGASAAVTEPSLELIAPRDSITIFRYPKEQVYLDLGILMGSRNAPFEVSLTRPDYTQPIVVEQILRGDPGESSAVELPTELLNGWEGFKDFFTVHLENKDGKVVHESTLPFCPNGWDRQRLTDNGPDRPSYPDTCYANPFTKGMVWGIDQDWAVNPFAYQAPYLSLHNGRFTATVSISDEFIDVLNIDPSMATATMAVKVKELEDEPCYKCPGGSFRPATPHAQRSQAVPTMDDPDPSILPDLAALPAWGIGINNGKKRSFLTFGATVWTGGASELVVEGFKRDGEEVMDGFQYFYVDGQPIGRSEVGTLEFDDRQGHQHWHFLQFAGYSLVAADENEIVKSKKEAFCLAPTDPIDLSLPGAEWNPYSVGLGTACGGQSSIWVREVLPLGWGDTYYQGIPGQSFNITDLPNGTYYIKVEANPGGPLHEQTADNNVELREIILGGEAGDRTVEVPPWNGIDTEGFPYGGIGGGGTNH